MSIQEKQAQQRAAVEAADVQHAAAQEQARKFTEQLQSHGQSAAAVMRVGRQG